MSEVFQRLFQRSEFSVQSLNVQAALGPVRVPERTQLSLLFRHFLERFFNHETASPDGDAKTRLVQIACAAGLPTLMVAVFLWPAYHPVFVWPPGRLTVSPPPYWTQVNHHFFFIIYSFAAMGLVTVFEWDMFFPDLLDVFVLGTMPVTDRKVFLARVGAIGVFIIGFLFDANIMAPLVLPMATDPPNLMRFLSGHLVAVFGSGLFAASFILALQSSLLAVLGERLFRRISLAMQGLAVMFLVMMLLLFPVLSGVTPTILQSGSIYMRWFPPFWFLAIDQLLLEGPSSLPIYIGLARTGLMATLVVVTIALVAYPLAYLRRVRFLVEGQSKGSKRSRMAVPLDGLLHATVVRPPVRRAVFHFIGQTLLRVPRYRIYLVLYGGVGLSVVVATILRLSVVQGKIRAEVSADGVRVAIGIVAFWVIAGLRTAFVSSGNQRGAWILRIIHGRPANFAAAIEQMSAAKVWAALSGTIITLMAFVALRMVSPAELLSWPATAAQLLLVGATSLLLTDAFFLNVTIVPFSGEPVGEQGNLAFTVLRYFTFFPLVTGLSLVIEHWTEASGRNFGIATISIIVAHLWLQKRHRDLIRLHSAQLDLEEGEDEFPTRLGLV